MRVGEEAIGAFFVGIAHRGAVQALGDKYRRLAFTGMKHSESVVAQGTVACARSDQWRRRIGEKLRAVGEIFGGGVAGAAKGESVNQGD